MKDADESSLRFICDAMLGGLARWLRAAGYEAHFEYGIDDGELVRRAKEEHLMLLSSDGQIFQRNVVKNGMIRALYVPQQLSKLEQLRFVIGRLELPLRPPRCMACGGRLVEVPKHTVITEAPPLAYRNCDRFWRCTQSQCRKLLWHGTHWQRITKRLEEIAKSPDADERQPS